MTNNLPEVPDTAEPAAVQHVRWTDMSTERLNPLLTRQFVVGAQTMVARIVLAKGCIVPMHSHHNEQISLIESGSLQFTINGHEIIVGPGELLCIPPNVSHMALALEDTVDIDFFVPPRQDWIDQSDSYLR